MNYFTTFTLVFEINFHELLVTIASSQNCNIKLQAKKFYFIQTTYCNYSLKEMTLINVTLTFLNHYKQHNFLPLRTVLKKWNADSAIV